MPEDLKIASLERRLRALEEQFASIQQFEPRIERSRHTSAQIVPPASPLQVDTQPTVSVKRQALKKMFHADKQIHVIILSFPSITRDGYPIERRDTLFLEFHDYACLRVKGLKRPIIQKALGSYNNSGKSIDAEVNKDIRIFSRDIDALLDVLNTFFLMGLELDQDTLAVEIDEELRLFKVKETRTVEVEIVQ